ncbi:MAG: nucleotide exchange factor GrpE [Butyrivibrio sp.]
MNKEVEDNIDNEAVDMEAEDINTEDVDTEEAADDIKEADINEETENASGEKDDKKGFFKKKDKKDKKDLQIEELTDKYRRTMAEFDNFRKRTEKEKSAMYEIGARDIVIKILPVVDNFERGLAAIPEDDRTTPVAEGMDKIYKQLTKTLEELGVKEIEAEGAEFNPDYHNAVMHVDDDSLGENVVAEVLQKGYFYKDSVVRHSMVKVAN